MTGDITVISGPTAVGKGTVVSVLRRRCPQVWVSVSATTRPPRPTEVDGVHYHFVSDAEFDDVCMCVLNANKQLKLVLNSSRFKTHAQREAAAAVNVG